MNQNLFGDQLHKVRTEMDITQKHLEHVCGFGPGTVSHYENYRREPSVTALRKLRRALGCSWEDLLGK